MTAATALLTRLNADVLRQPGRSPLDAATVDQARTIVDAVRQGGDTALRQYAAQFGELNDRTGVEESLVIGRADLEQALDAIDSADRAVLERTAARIESFARAQRASIVDVETLIDGGIARQVASPVESAGCYVPGGRYPLPSTMLMTAVTARMAGVDRVVAASPRPTQITLAAAAIAGVDALHPVGGAQAIAALAYGTESIKPVDMIVGPGNRWVTAAKSIVSDVVGIDMLAGPSELLIIADDSANSAWIAADLLAQAEHDVDAVPMLVTLDESLADRVERALAIQLDVLPTANVARKALSNGGCAVATSLADAAAISNASAPEHLQVCLRDVESLRPMLRHFGALFVGERSAEVFGDYGAGPNHTLPTGAGARANAGLSVSTFLRLQTELEITNDTDARQMMTDAAALARMEGLEAHRAAAVMRLHLDA